MILLVRQELAKLYRRLSPYVIYGAICALIALVVLNFKLNPPYFVSGERAGAALPDFQVVGSPLNGLLICEFVFKSLAQLLPFLAPIVAGEVLGAEGAAGTLRTILVRPRSRTAIWTAKLIAVMLYTLSLSVVTMAFSLLAGWAVFGRGKLWEFQALMDHRVLVMTELEGLRYLALGYLMMAVAVFVTSALGFMAGSFFDNGLVPGFVALGIVLTVTIGGAMDFEWIERLRPYLFTTQIGEATRVIPVAFDPATQDLVLPEGVIGNLLRTCTAYSVTFCLLGWARFVRRDVTC